ncbi:MAG TPA: hypothetical protein VFG50_11505 [Rhodothermales bacterium]|nr:hypothetical protein [Rhodothermales bacterium]
MEILTGLLYLIVLVAFPIVAIVLNYLKHAEHTRPEQTIRTGSHVPDHALSSARLVED